MVTLNIREIEEKIEEFIYSSEGEFSIDEACASVAVKELASEQQNRLEDEVKNILSDSPMLLYSSNTGKYISRDIFFKDAKFLIVPSEMEIKNRILIPGHRFAPFCAVDIFPSEIKLSDLDGCMLKVKDISIPVEEAAAFHSLLGAEQMFEFFVADNPANSTVLEKQNAPENKILLSVLDMEDFYKSNSFVHGDGFVVIVKDWDLGEFQYEHIPASKIDAKASEEWISSLADSMEEIIETYSNYIEIPEQFARAFFVAGREILDSPAASIEEFYMRSERIQIGYLSGVTVLTIVNNEEDKGEDSEEDYDWNAPENVMISQGATGAFSELLKDIGCVLQESEVEGFMLDQFYRDEPVFDLFYQRCFSGERLKFADEAQEVIFLNQLEDMWEKHIENYNKFVDENKGPVRSRLLEIVEERMNWMHYLGDLEINIEDLTREEAFSNLVSASVHFTSLCQLLNSEEHFVSGSEVEGLLESIEQMADLQKSYIETLNGVIAKLAK